MVDTAKQLERQAKAMLRRAKQLKTKARQLATLEKRAAPLLAKIEKLRKELGGSSISKAGRPARKGKKAKAAKKTAKAKKRGRPPGKRAKSRISAEMVKTQLAKLGVTDVPVKELRKALKISTVKDLRDLYNRLTALKARKIVRAGSNPGLLTLAKTGGKASKAK